MTAPRYLQLAEALRAEIVDGALAIGDQLPTEHALMERHRVSRHTVREALRQLSQSGLISRRQGAGSVVIATSPPVLYAQKIGNKADLLQYARSARMKITDVSPLNADSALVEQLRLSPGQRYVRFSGIRLGEDSTPLALTDIYVVAALAPRVEELPDRPGSITDWIAREKNIPTARIDQAIAAHALTAREAEALSSIEDSPALITRRFYYDAEDRLITASRSIHPGDRFVYEMTLEREG